MRVTKVTIEFEDGTSVSLIDTSGVLDDEDSLAQTVISMARHTHPATELLNGRYNRIGR